MKFEMQTCGGCRTCEIACSYHHTGEFAPSLSSIKIHEKESGKGNMVELIEEDSDLGKACDGCLDQKEPLCMKFCIEKEVLGEIINKLLQSKKQISS